MRRLFAFNGILILACSGTLSFPLSAQMAYRVSVYNAVSQSGSEVYGTSSTVDTSIGCGHGSYITTSTLITPDGRQYSSSGYLSSSVYGPTNGVSGTYTVSGTVQFRCSCNGLVGGGGPPAQGCVVGSRRQNRVLPAHCGAVHQIQIAQVLTQQITSDIRGVVSGSRLSTTATSTPVDEKKTIFFHPKQLTETNTEKGDTTDGTHY